MTRGVEIPLDADAALERLLERTRAAGEHLRACSDARVTRSLTAALAQLMDRGTPLGRQLEATLPARARLSPEATRWGLETSVEALSAPALEDALERLRDAPLGVVRAPVGLAALVLAGNVFTAGLRPLAWALLARVPTVVKVSSRDEGLVELFALSLALVDPELADTVGVARFSRDDDARFARLAARVDVVSAHGTDRTIEALRAATPATTDFVAHGHGLSLAWVPRGALTDADDPRALASALALDVAAYDQRGCLSPHAVLVERGGTIRGRDLARTLAEEGLAPLARTLPRGPLDLDASTQQLQWRGVSQALFDLHEGSGFAVSFEGGSPLRACPGARNIAVHEVDDEAAFFRRIVPLGAHLKGLAVAGTPARRAELARRLPPGLAPRVAAPGALQRPSLAAATDGVPPWQGLVRTLSL